jgi:cytochrome P450
VSNSLIGQVRPFFDPVGAEFQQNPFAGLRRLREHDPVHLTRQGWLLTRYDDCADVLASRDFGMSGIADVVRRRVGTGPAAELIANRFHSFDPPEHTRLRSLVGGAFSARRVGEMRGPIEVAADRFLDEIKDEAAFDVVESFACRLPSWVIGEMLGLPMDRRTEVNEWSDRILTLQGRTQPDQRTKDEGHVAARQFMAYAHDLVGARRGDAGGGLLSDLIDAAEDPERVTLEEVAEFVVFLSNAGFSTTRNLIGSAVVALLSDIGQWDVLVAEPGLIVDAVAEALRYDCPLTSTPRFAREATAVGGRMLPAGAAVYCLLNAANRDPERFPDPDRFDILRTDKKHLAFGGGPHYCLGASLARLQIEVALMALVRRYPQLRLAAGRIEWRPGMYRGPKHVPVFTSEHRSEQ